MKIKQIKGKDDSHEPDGPAMKFVHIFMNLWGYMNMDNSKRPENLSANQQMGEPTQHKLMWMEYSRTHTCTNPNNILVILELNILFRRGS